MTRLIYYSISCSFQWEQECLAFLLRLITQFSIDQSDVEAGHDDVFETQESPRKKLKKHKYDKIIIPRLDQVMYYWNVSSFCNL